MLGLCVALKRFKLITINKSINITVNKNNTYEYQNHSHKNLQTFLNISAQIYI